jgi:regulator of sigma E protease
MYIVFAILAFSVLVVGHELGHFTMAKLNGVKVEEFSIGMGPKLFGIKGKETEYVLKAFPIGGYVRMLGEEEKSNDSRAFSNKSPERKLSIIAAGPIMNFIMAILFFMIIAFANGFITPVISSVQQSSPAELAGIKQGDKIIKINDRKITTWEDLSTEIFSSGENSLNIVLRRNDEIKAYEVKPVLDEKEKRYIIGIIPTKVTNPGILESMKYGFDETISLVKQTATTFKSLFKGKLKADDFGGPVTIIKISGEAAKAGFWNLLFFCAFMSVQLAIFNIIPFPALDGGWIFLLLFEIITRKKVDDKKVAVVNYIGFTVLMILMVLVTIKDIFFPINF